MRIGSDLVWQLQGETLGSVVEQVRQCREGDRTASPVSFVHAVNLYLLDDELPADQVETVRAIARAQATADVTMRVMIISDPADTQRLQAIVGQLIESAVVVAAEFAARMPKLHELMSCVSHNVSPAEHVVFTNADICPVPGFYDAAAALLRAGAESLVVNRRSTFGFFPGEVDAALAAHSLGAAHPGFDCFVFAAGALSEMVQAESSIGTPYVMLPLLLNLVAVSSPLLVLTDAHLTYHFGDDRSWASDGRNAGANQNLAVAAAVRDGHSDAGTQRVQAFLAAFPNWNPEAIGTS